MQIEKENAERRRNSRRISYSVSCFIRRWMCCGLSDLEDLLNPESEISAVNLSQQYTDPVVTEDDEGGDYGVHVSETQYSGDENNEVHAAESQYSGDGGSDDRKVHAAETQYSGVGEDDGDGEEEEEEEEVRTENNHNLVSLPELEISVVQQNVDDYDYDEEERVIGEVDEIRWIKHYCSNHKILLVGEGDFSFSASLALAFGSASNMIATSLNSIEFLRKNYMKAKGNIDILSSRGCMVMHGVDATKMGQHSSLKGIKFDRIIYNFPHAGYFDQTDAHLRQNQTLVKSFMKNAKNMLESNGEIHITHKSSTFASKWNLRNLASLVGLELVQEVPFNYRDYNGYRTKYGFGGDKNFNCIPSKTYKFVLEKKYY